MKAAIVKQNLEFIYGKNKDNVKLQDPDKVAYVRSEVQPKGYAKDEAIVGFTGEWEVLLPTYKCDVYMKDDTAPYPSFEHALQASKFLLAEDRHLVREMNDIVEVKRFVSRHKSDASKVKQDWTEHGLAIAKKLLRDKFMRSKPVKFALMKTGHKKLIYQNEFNDQYWGVNPAGKGANHLGVLLQQIRLEIDYGEDIDHWIQDNLVLMHKEDVRIVVDINDPVNAAVRRRIAEAKAAKEKAAKEAKQAQNNSQNSKKDNNKDSTTEKIEIADPNHLQFESKNILYFGSADFNHVVILDSTASRIHAAVVMGSDRVAYVVDLGSSNGTYLTSLAIDTTNTNTTKIKIPAFTFVPIAPAATLTITESGDVEPSIIQGNVLFGHSEGVYALTVHSNATDLRQAELLARINSTNNVGDGSNGNNNSQSSENTIFLRNIDPTTTDDELREFLSACGEIATLHIPRDRSSQLASRGIAFVTFVDSYSVYQALTLDGDQLKTSYVKIKRSEAQGGAAIPQNNPNRSTNSNSNNGSRKEERRQHREEIANNAMRMSGSAGQQQKTQQLAEQSTSLHTKNSRDSRGREERRRDDSRSRRRSRDRHATTNSSSDKQQRHRDSRSCSTERRNRRTERSDRDRSRDRYKKRDDSRTRSTDRYNNRSSRAESRDGNRHRSSNNRTSNSKRGDSRSRSRDRPNRREDNLEEKRSAKEHDHTIRRDDNRDTDSQPHGTSGGNNKANDMNSAYKKDSDVNDESRVRSLSRSPARKRRRSPSSSDGSSADSTN